MRFPSKEVIEALRREYPAGTLVELVEMDDAFAPPVGTKGRVTCIDDVGTIFVAWQTGSGLGVAYGKDRIRKAVNKDVR